MLERHPDVEQAVVVPAPDEIKYRIPWAFIVKRAGSSLSEEDVKQHALKNAPPYQYPRKVIFVPTMPMNAIGKIDRKGMTSRVAAMVSEANTAAE
jgi:long-chain acyl-CoA synthetase